MSDLFQLRAYHEHFYDDLRSFEKRISLIGGVNFSGIVIYINASLDLTSRKVKKNVTILSIFDFPISHNKLRHKLTRYRHLIIQEHSNTGTKTCQRTCKSLFEKVNYVKIWGQLIVHFSLISVRSFVNKRCLTRRNPYPQPNYLDGISLLLSPYKPPVIPNSCKIVQTYFY